MKDSCLQIADSMGLPAIAKGSNFVYSPISIRAALSLAAAGANGETLHQLLHFLGFSTLQNLNEFTHSLLESIRENDAAGLIQDDNFIISFANGIWVDESLTLKKSFQEIAASVYNAATKSVDFYGKHKEAAEEVNQWIQSKTNGLIKDIIPPGAVNRLTASILANALYFKAPWLQPFPSYLTKSGSFHLLNGKTVQIPFMSSPRDYQYIASFDHFKVLKLPYKQKQSSHHKFSMLIFLPATKDGIDILLHSVVNTPNFIMSHVPCDEVLVGNFKVPKFKVSSEFEASKALEELGLVVPLSDGANFSEMVDERVTISGVIHGATIEVDESGTEASATTVIIMQMQCMPIGARADFVADHPFLFAIVEEVSGAVLFMGHVADPSKYGDMMP